MEQNSIGTKIASLRKTNGCTQAQLGEYLNISYQAVSKWERGEASPDFDTMSKIAKFFNVPLSYFEKDGQEEAAVTAVAEPAPTPVVTPAPTPVKEMLGVCKQCGKVVYEGDEGVKSPALMCKKCVEERKRAEQRKAEEERKARERKIQEEKLKAARRKEEIKRSRNKGLIWGAVITGILFICSLFGGFPSNGAGAVIGHIFELLLGAAVIFTFVSQLFWDGAVLDCVLAGGKVIGTPGIIFSFDLDGFIFLIAMKILFALLRMFVFLLTALVCVFAGIVISPFTFFFALHRVNSGDLV